ncbi:MAG: 6-bladed beta-propeller [Acidobacteriota bacterium]|jgi:hypothetical protein
MRLTNGGRQGASNVARLAGRRTPCVLGVLLAGTLVACVAAEQTPEPAGDLTVVEDLRIGLSQGPEEYLFGDIGGIVQHGDGTVSILDSQVPVIRHYDAEGTFLYDIGREGQGPGEYSEQIQGMQRLPDDSFAIWDTGNTRISIFSPAGELVESIHSPTSGYYTGSTMWVDEQGNYYLYTVDRSAPLREGEFPPRVYIEVSPSGEQIGKIAVPDYAPIPATKPAFMDLHGGIDGTVWVRRYATARERTDRPPRPPDDPRPTFNWWQPITLDGFDEEGEFLGTVELPNDTWVSVLSRDWIWTVQPNEDDETVAVRYRIEGGR